MKEERRNILLVDDDSKIRETISRLLEEEDTLVTAVCDASEAIAALSKRVYDLVITDLKMPGEFSGLDLLKIIKAGFDTPVIVISGFGTLEVALSAMRHGAVDFVPKPINSEYLSKLVMKTFEASAGKVWSPGDMKFELKIELRGNEDAPPNLRDLLLKLTPSIGLSDAKAASLWLAIKEAIRNAATHGNRNDPSKTVTVVIENSSREIDIVVADQGDGFCYGGEAGLEDKSERFRLKGLNLIKNLVDDVKFNKQGNEIMFVMLK